MEPHIDTDMHWIHFNTLKHIQTLEFDTFCHHASKVPEKSRLVSWWFHLRARRFSSRECNDCCCGIRCCDPRALSFLFLLSCYLVHFFVAWFFFPPLFLMLVLFPSAWSYRLVNCCYYLDHCSRCHSRYTISLLCSSGRRFVCCICSYLCHCCCLMLQPQPKRLPWLFRTRSRVKNYTRKAWKRILQNCFKELWYLQPKHSTRRKLGSGIRNTGFLSLEILPDCISGFWQQDVAFEQLVTRSQSFYLISCWEINRFNVKDALLISLRDACDTFLCYQPTDYKDRWCVR